MAKKTKHLKYLSKSVLLEESGLPMVNKITIVGSFILVVLFMIWANFMVVNDTVVASGNVVMESSGSQSNTFLAYVPSGEIGGVREGLDVKVSIPGVTKKNKLDGTIDYIVKSTKSDSRSKVYYEASVSAFMSDETRAYLKETIMDGMEVKVEIITGHRTLLQYMLGNLWDVKSENNL